MSSDRNATVRSDRHKEKEFLEKVLEAFKQMDDEEQHQTFVDAGIVNQEGELTTTYGGDAEPEED